MKEFHLYTFFMWAAYLAGHFLQSPIAWLLCCVLWSFAVARMCHMYFRLKTMAEAQTHIIGKLILEKLKHEGKI